MRNVILAMLGMVSVAEAAPTFAVVSTEQVFHECSGAGGEHYVFAIDGDTRVVHAGGHSQYLGLLPDRIGLAGTPIVASAPRWFVAELAMSPPVSADADGNPDSSVSGWCLDRLPRFSGEVLRLVPAADRDAAVKLHATITANGLPRASLTLKAAKRETFALARVTGSSEVSGGRRYAIEAIDGDVPASFDVPERMPAVGRSWMVSADELWTGDLVVVATAGRGMTRRATRVLAADDLADGRRWLALMRGGEPWPPSALLPGTMGALAVTRWAVFGKVVSGKRGCGLELQVKRYDPQSFILRPERVAAPAGVTKGDEVTAVVVPNTGGADTCGRTARVVRAYVTPGAERAWWMVGGEAAPAGALPAILE
jgi:hypothetical protein